MEKPLLNKQKIFPSDEVQKNVLGNSFAVYKESVAMLNTLSNKVIQSK